jgi:hypothetical protein
VKPPISPKIHGVIDYTTSSAVAAAPRALKLPPAAAAVCYGLGAGYTALSMLTRYPAGAKKVVPFKAHGLAEAAIGIALPFVPALLGLKRGKGAKRAKMVFYGLAALTGVVATLTDWNSPQAKAGV